MSSHFARDLPRRCRRVPRERRLSCLRRGHRPDASHVAPGGAAGRPRMDGIDARARATAAIRVGPAPPGAPRTAPRRPRGRRPPTPPRPAAPGSGASAPPGTRRPHATPPGQARSRGSARPRLDGRLKRQGRSLPGTEEHRRPPNDAGIGASGEPGARGRSRAAVAQVPSAAARSGAPVVGIGRAPHGDLGPRSTDVPAGHRQRSGRVLRGRVLAGRAVAEPPAPASLRRRMLGCP